MKFLKWLRKPMKWAIYLAVAGCCLVVGINLYMQGTVKKRIVTPEQAAELDKVDCILVQMCIRDRNMGPALLRGPVFCVETVSALRDKTGNQRRKKAFVTLLRRFCRKQAEAVHRE